VPLANEKGPDDISRPEYGVSKNNNSSLQAPFKVCMPPPLLNLNVCSHCNANMKEKIQLEK